VEATINISESLEQVTASGAQNLDVFMTEDTEDATHCPTCKVSRYVEVEGSDGIKR
jgi:hypothetical protein